MPATLEFITEQVLLSEELRAGRETMLDPEDLPGKYGRVVREVNEILQLIKCEAVVAGGWAAWYRGYVDRVAQNVEIVLPANRIEEFRQIAAISGFELVPSADGRWPLLIHKATSVKLHILLEGARPYTSSRQAPTTIPTPRAMGAQGWRLRYMSLTSLIELKLATGWHRDLVDVMALAIANRSRLEEIRNHLANVLPDYAAQFEQLVKEAEEQADD